MATGLDWSKHFQTQDVGTRARIVEAIDVLLNDYMFATNYGKDLHEIKALICAPIGGGAGGVMLKARVNTQHEYITLHVEHGNTGQRINLTGSFSGEKASYRGLDKPMIDRLLNAFHNVMIAEGATLKRRFEDLKALAEKQATFEGFAQALEAYKVPAKEKEG